MRRERSSELMEQSRRLIPGGVNSPVRAFDIEGIEPPVIKRGSGCRLWDEDGNEYIDCVGSWGPLILGHAHPDVVDAVKRATEDGTSFGAPTKAELELAELLVERVPAVDMVRLVNSGTEATMTAARLARGYAGRDRIVKMEGCYHGHGDCFLVEAGSGAATLGTPTSPGVPEGTAADTLTARFNDIESVEELYRQHPDEIAAVIVEPVCGNSGVIPPEDEFLQDLRELTRRHSSLLIFDEVMTGFRVSPDSAQGLYGVEPDLTTLGKVIGGGMPIGAVGGRREVMEHLAPSGPVYQAGTLSGNPVAVAAGLATLRALDEGAYATLEERGSRLEEGMRRNVESLGLPYHVSRVGGMASLFFTDGPVHTPSDAKQFDEEAFARYFASMLEQGIYLPPSQFESFFIGTAHGPDDIDRIVDAQHEALQEIA